MAGRSRQAMFNTLVLVVINVGGNLLFVPDHGITAAGITWGATILVAAAAPRLAGRAGRSAWPRSADRPFVAVAAVGRDRRSSWASAPVSRWVTTPPGCWSPVVSASLAYAVRARARAVRTPPGCLVERHPPPILRRHP